MTGGVNLRIVTRSVRMMEVKVRLQSECSMVPDGSAYVKFVLALGGVETKFEVICAIVLIYVGMEITDSQLCID